MQCCATVVNMAKLGSNQSEREKDNGLLSFWGVWLISIGYVINFFHVTPFDQSACRISAWGQEHTHS